MSVQTGVEATPGADSLPSLDEHDLVPEPADATATTDATDTEPAPPAAGRKTLRSTVALALAEWGGTLRAGLLLLGLVVASGVAIAVAARWVPELSGPVAGIAALVAAVVTSKLKLRRETAR